MDNMTFGKYIPGNSIIHRLDPRLKICAVFIFLISVFFDAGFIGYGILAIYVLLCSLVSKIKLSHILKAIKPMVFMMLFLMIFTEIILNTSLRTPTLWINKQHNCSRRISFIHILCFV